MTTTNNIIGLQCRAQMHQEITQQDIQVGMQNAQYLQSMQAQAQNAQYLSTIGQSGVTTLTSTDTNAQNAYAMYHQQTQAQNMLVTPEQMQDRQNAVAQMKNHRMALAGYSIVDQMRANKQYGPDHSILNGIPEAWEQELKTILFAKKEPDYFAITRELSNET